MSDRSRGCVLITGSAGRLGYSLTMMVSQQYGSQNVIATDLKSVQLPKGVNFRLLDVLDKSALLGVVKELNITAIYHMAARLYSYCEHNRDAAWSENVDGLRNVLDAAKIFGLQVFFASSIAAGEQSPSVYGMSKSAGEKWCHYYWETFGVDVRAIRFPGIYCPGSAPRGGMMDILYSAIHAAKTGQTYTGYLRQDTVIPAIHVQDACRAVFKLMQLSTPKHFEVYDLVGFLFNSLDLSAAIRVYYPDFKMGFREDNRQGLAESWPVADADRFGSDISWGPEYNLQRIVDEALN